MLSDDRIKEAGIFNVKHVNLLLSKMKNNKMVSEIDNMALTGILSTQILYDLFTKKSKPALANSELVSFNKEIIDIQTKKHVRYEF